MVREYSAGELIEEAEPGEEILPVKPKEEKIEEPEDMALAGLLDELGSASDAIVRIYECSAQGRKLEYLFECSPAEFSFDKLRDEYGGGDFRVQVRQPGRRGLLANKLISIKRTVKPVSYPVNQISPEQITDAISRGINETLARLLPMIQSQNKPIDMADVEDRFMQRMVLMKQLFAPSNDGASNIDTLLKGMELAKELNKTPGEANITDLLIETVKTFGRPLADIVAKQAVAPKIPQVKPPIVGAISIDPEDNLKMPITVSDPNLQHLAPYVDFLLVQAKADRNTEIYANFILDQLDPAVAEQYIGKGDLFEIIKKIRPEAAAYEAWFRELQTVARELLEEEKKDLTEAGQEASLGPEEGAGTGADAPGYGKPEGGAGSGGASGEPD